MAQGQPAVATNFHFPFPAILSMLRSSSEALQHPRTNGDIRGLDEITAASEGATVTQQQGHGYPTLRPRRPSVGSMDVQPRANDASNTPVYDNQGSPPVLTRAGLLQPRSYNLPDGFGSYNGVAGALLINPIPHSPDSIRTNTMQLSGMAFSPTSSVPPVQEVNEAQEFVFPGADVALAPASYSSQSINEELANSRLTLASDLRSSLASSLPTASSPSLASSIGLRPHTPPPPSPPQSGASTPHLPPRPSGLSLLRQEYESGHSSGSGSEGSSTPTRARSVSPHHVQKRPPYSTTSTSRVHWSDRPENGLRTTSVRSTSPTPGGAVTPHISPPPPPSSPPITEITPLLRRPSLSFSPAPSLLEHPHQHLHMVKPPPSGAGESILSLLASGHLTTKVLQEVPHVLRVALKSIPAVLLGCLLNILDGVSYGMIIFPGTGVFADLGPMGVSMFFLTTVLAQLVYTFGGSGFAGGNGSMMIEVVPFFHILATDIASQIGDDKPGEIIATTLAAYAMSSILTGLTFFLLGALKLGVLIGFFPRHILVGCIGGVGVFLIVTGFAVSMRIGEDDLSFSWKSFEMMFLNGHNLTLWVIPLVLAVLLRMITQKYHHQLIFPIYFLTIPVIFYIVVAASQIKLWDLRREGWLFDMGTAESESWYKFYSYFDFTKIQFAPLFYTLPTQFALLFFNILHPPLNVPALSVSLNEDIDTNKELMAHGYSNLLAGFFGTVPNYLVYVNTLLFYRVGGTTRIAGFLLAVMTAVLLVIGTAPIAYIPVMVVGALIFVLGIDLVKEAVWDTRHRTSRTEYITIISIMVCMTVWDFVAGVLFGIIASCFFFVVQNSQRKSIRSLHTGETAMSTVRRPSLQRAYLREVSKQTTILRLQGFLFFGTISYVEDAIKEIVNGPSWQSNPIRFLVLDFKLVAGVDMSSAEAFVRIQRFLSAKGVTLVFCGFTPESAVGQALQSVQVLGSDHVELFSTFNDAMEWTENVYLRAWFMAQKHEVAATTFALPGRQDFNLDDHIMSSFVSSPRGTYMRDVGNRTIAHEPQPEADYSSEPLNTLVKAFSSYGDMDGELFLPLKNYLERLAVPEGYVLWKKDDPPDGLYIVESGVLRAIYKFADHTPRFEESMVPGTVAGELSALSALPRNATVVVERDATLWKLSMGNLARLENENPNLARTFLRLILKAAKIDHDILLAALSSRQ
ncbi:Uncharacterized protein C24H6.11c [Hypsizygus marmoreus]|uniref:Uncharacterized protein C24H6.11c n=1 Tax=Hypsizygus marmoreus TaxID=39966 RepID=A0A369JQZ1_HYPMA|nr:Uncharacterized protein C24H6.11c [Hypsizygus marmoreus]